LTQHVCAFPHTPALAAVPNGHTILGGWDIQPPGCAGWINNDGNHLCFFCKKVSMTEKEKDSGQVLQPLPDMLFSKSI
jgi:hypothetical protein